MVDKAVETFGGLHIAFNNHGVGSLGTFASASDKDVTGIFDNNLKSLVFCFKYQVGTLRWIQFGDWMRMVARLL